MNYVFSYGSDNVPIMVTDLQMNVKYANRAASIKSTISMSRGGLARSLSPANMHKVYLCRRTGKPQVFRQRLGDEYKLLYVVKVQREENRLVFTFTKPYKKMDFRQNDIKTWNSTISETTDNILENLIQLKKSRSAQTRESAEDSYKSMLCLLRSVRQWQALYMDGDSLAFHLPTLLNHLLPICQEHLKNTRYSLHFEDFSGDSVVRCNLDLLRTAILSSLAAVMYYSRDDATVTLHEYEDYVRMDIYGGPHPLTVPTISHARNDSMCRLLDVPTLPDIMAKVQGELNIRILKGEKFVFSLIFPTAKIDGAVRVHMAEMLKEKLSSCEIEFSIL